MRKLLLIFVLTLVTAAAFAGDSTYTRSDKMNIAVLLEGDIHIAEKADKICVKGDLLADAFKTRYYKLIDEARPMMTYDTYPSYTCIYLKEDWWDILFSNPSGQGFSSKQALQSNRFKISEEGIKTDQDVLVFYAEISGMNFKFTD